jgi:hypothetical protein
MGALGHPPHQLENGFHLAVAEILNELLELALERPEESDVPFRSQMDGLHKHSSAML